MGNSLQPNNKTNNHKNWKLEHSIRYNLIFMMFSTESHYQFYILIHSSQKCATIFWWFFFSHLVHLQNDEILNWWWKKNCYWRLGRWLKLWWDCVQCSTWGDEMVQLWYCLGLWVFLRLQFGIILDDGSETTTGRLPVVEFKQKKKKKLRSMSVMAELVTKWYLMPEANAQCGIQVI